MDYQRDFVAFQKLVTRLCETLNKPCTDDLVESWWKALRHADLAAVEKRVDEFIAKAGEGTKFPRPAQVRPEGTAVTTADGQDYQRGFWRSLIVNTVAEALDLTIQTLEPVIVANRATLGAWMQVLLNDICRKDNGHSLNWELQALCAHEAKKVAHRFSGSRRVLEQYPDNHWTGDNWDIAANRHFLAHILRRVQSGQRPYTPAETAIMVRWKNKWASDMREEATAKGVDPGYQREVWGACMDQGHQEFDAPAIGRDAA